MKIKHILLFLMAWVSSMNLAYAQQTVVASGSVMDEKGELLIGVSISVKEVPSMGAITDIDVRFKIGGIKAGHTLVISYVGYDPQEIKMNKSDERMRVVLKESSNVMDEVVITASGKVQKKINVTGAITGVEVATLKTPATSISNMLGGRVPGIISVTRSGEPGKDFSEFWVRGISTFGAGQGALVLIDGIEGNLNTLDPEDIESFSILKDASSTAVYGVRGANGVVLVSTKKGKAGKLNLQVKANTGISYSPQMPKYVRAAEYAALANEAAVTRGRIPVYTDVDLALFRNHMDPDFHPDVDWRDVILKDYTWNQQYFLSASGGGEVARYYISAGFTTKDAIFKQDKGVNKYNTNVNYKQPRAVAAPAGAGAVAERADDRVVYRVPEAGDQHQQRNRRHADAADIGVENHQKIADKHPAEIAADVAHAVGDLADQRNLDIGVLLPGRCGGTAHSAQLLSLFTLFRGLKPGFVRDFHDRLDDVRLVGDALVHRVLDVVKVENVGHDAFEVDFARGDRVDGHGVDVAVAEHGLEGHRNQFLCTTLPQVHSP